MKSSEFIYEARVEDDDDIVGYEEVPLKKRDPHSDIDSIIVTLKGKRSEYFTKLARRFDRANRIKKLLAAEEKKLKAQTKGSIDDLFEAGEEIYTRVVETASLVFKIAKSGENTVDKLDQKGYLDELEKLSGLAVKELQELKEKHTNAVTSKVVPKVLAPREKKPQKESVNEGVLDQVRDYAARVKDYITKFLTKWDAQFSRVKSKIDKELDI